MGKKVKSYRKKSPLILVVAVAVVGVLGFLTYRLIDSGSLGSQNASAGSVKEMTVEGFKVTLTPSRSILKAFTTGGKNTPTTTWRYTITGKNSACYKPVVRVQNEAKPNQVNAQKVNTILLVLDLTEQKGCTNKRALTITTSGVFQAYTNSNLRYIVQFSPAVKKINTPRSTTPTFETTNKGFKLTSRQRSNGLWAYTVTGKAGNCYVADVSAGGDVDAGSTGSFSGIYTLRLVKSPNKDCVKTTDLKLSGTADGKKYKGNDYYFKVRYAQNVELVYTENKGTAKTLKSGPVTLQYKYASNGIWNYTVSGCNIISVTAPVSKSQPAKVSVSVTCNDVLAKEMNSKSGTIAAPSDAVFSLNLVTDRPNNGTDRPDNVKTLSSGKVTLSYSYSGNGTWKYTVTGCSIQQITAPVSKSKPAKVAVTALCNSRSLDSITVSKTGTITAPEDSVFSFTATYR
ncbi:MAG TPA: hypothetical protein PLV59_02185 [Candidatus Dojkabacteria bacterium]|nr:hypothetical protein [Candidatus Dojkabacteria bacterium]